MAEQKKTYKVARPVVIGRATYFTGVSVPLEPAVAAPLLASGQIYEPEPEPSAADLDAVADEKKAAEATAKPAAATEPKPADAPKG